MDNKENKTAKAARLVGELFREGTNIAKVYSLLADYKPHSRKEIAAAVGVKEDRYPHVFANLIRTGKTTGKFTVQEESGSATMVLGKKETAPDGPKPKIKPLSSKAKVATSAKSAAPKGQPKLVEKKS